MNGENSDLMSYKGCRPTNRGRNIDRYEYVSQTDEYVGQTKDDSLQKRTRGRFLKTRKVFKPEDSFTKPRSVVQNNLLIQRMCDV